MRCGNTRERGAGICVARHARSATLWVPEHSPGGPSLRVILVQSVPGCPNLPTQSRSAAPFGSPDDRVPSRRSATESMTATRHCPDRPSAVSPPRALPSRDDVRGARRISAATAPTVGGPTTAPQRPNAQHIDIHRSPDGTPLALLNGSKQSTMDPGVQSRPFQRRIRKPHCPSSDDAIWRENC